MTLPPIAGLREYGKRGPPRITTVRADAGQAQIKAPPEAGVWSYEPKWDVIELVKIVQRDSRIAGIPYLLGRIGRNIAAPIEVFDRASDEGNG
jgi:hypothetical protein